MEVDFNLNELSQFFLEHSGQEMATLVSEEEPSVADFEEEDVEGNDNTPDCIEEGSCWWDWTIGNRDASLAATSYRGSDEEDEDHLLLLRNASSPYHQQEQQLRRDADQDGRSAASCLTRGTKKLLRTLCSLIVYSAPFRFFFKLVFWLINIASGGAHLSGTVSGLSKLFPSLGSPTATNLKLHHIAIPFQISDAVGHIAVSILGSNEMIDGIARSVSSSSCCSSRRSSSSSSSPSKCSQCRMDFWTCCLSCRHELCPCCENGDISSVHHYESPQRHLATTASQRLRTLPSHDHNASSQARSDDEPSFLLSFQQPAASSAADSRGSSTRTNGNIRRPRKVASFWNEDETPSVAARVGLFLLTLFLVFCAEVSSTYRNWQNNAALPISSRIFWVAFYLASHVPEVLYSTMLMVRDYFYGFRLSRQQENMLKDHLVAQIALFRVQQRHPHQAFQDLEPEVIDPDLFSASSSSSSAAASCASFAPFSFEAMHKHKKDFDVEEADEEQDHLDQLLQKRRKTDRLARWISRIFGFLFVLPTYVVKTMSAVGGFRLITGHNEWASWVLGVSGMLAEAYLEYAFTQELFGELIVIIAYRVQGFKRRETGYLFYALTPITYVCILSLSLLVGFLTIPGSYNSAYGVLPDTWDHWKLAICWLYAARYILQAATGLKLLLQNIVSTLRAHYSPPFARLLRAIKDHRSLFLYQFKHLLSPDPAAACQKRCLPFAPQTPSSVLRSPSLIN